MRTLLKPSLALLLVLIAAAAVLLTYRAERSRVQEPLPDAAVPEPSVAALAPEEAEDGTPGPALPARVFYFRHSAASPGRIELSSTEEEILQQSNPAAMALVLARAALARSRSLVGPRAAVDQVFLLEDGTAVVDLARQTSDQVRGSAACELGLLNAIARSLTANLDEIKRVRFLLGGQEAETLAGHVSLRMVFR